MICEKFLAVLSVGGVSRSPCQAIHLDAADGDCDSKENRNYGHAEIMVQDVG